MNNTAVYRWYDDAGELLYIGHTTRLATRVDDHLREWKSPWSVLAARVEIDWYPSLAEAKEAEANAIATGQPLFNGTYNRWSPEAADRRDAYLAARGLPDLLQKPADQLHVEHLYAKFPGWRIWPYRPDGGPATWYARPQIATLSAGSPAELAQQIAEHDAIIAEQQRQGPLSRPEQEDQ